MNRERRSRIAKIVETLQDLVPEIEELAAEEREAFENLPESMQYGERGEAMEVAAEHLDEASMQITDVIDALNNASE